MNQILHQTRNQRFLRIKKQIKESNINSSRRKPKPLQYPQSSESKTIIFRIKYRKKLSLVAKLALSSFKNKYIYYAIDDILYLFKSNQSERDNLLAILYSPVLSLQNNFSVNFFDIWISEIHINEVSKVNKFLNNDSSNFEQLSYLTIELLYKKPRLLKKLDE